MPDMSRRDDQASTEQQTEESLGTEWCNLRCETRLP